jgi:3-oxoacyl-[acyl-carrier protein] reductase
LAGRLRYAWLASVVVNYSFSDSDAESTVNEIKPICALQNQNVVLIKADTSQYTQCKSLVKEALAAFGKVDILVLNAAILTNESLDKITEGENILSLVTMVTFSERII